MKRLDHNLGHQWHVAINQYCNTLERHKNAGWMYDAKHMAEEIPRLVILFGLERKGELAQVHQQCSRTEPEPISDNHLTCCLGVKCKECPMLLALEEANLTAEQKDEVKAWTCAAHILSEKEKRMIDNSEGYILTVDDRMFWDTVYANMSAPDEISDEPTDEELGDESAKGVQ